MVTPVKIGAFGKQFVLRYCLIVLITMSFLSACSRQPNRSATSTTSGSPPAASDILSAKVEAVKFDQVTQALDDLHRHHPDVVDFSIKSVYYNRETRDKVLNICSQGSALSSTQREREQEKVMACAPLIFFYYNYGEQKSIPEAIEVAQKIYWFAATDNPSLGPEPEALKAMLQGWGIQ